MTGTDLEIGSVLADRFRISALLGRGGMATVYRADDESLGRTVALKVIRGDLADGEDLQRQQDEIQLLATLNHPGLVTLFDAATDAEDQAFLVMELVEGTDLHSRLRDGNLPTVEVARIGQSLAEALVYVHAQGVIHRDIKPGNILLPAADAALPGQHAKLADFGIARIVDGARLTATGKVLGTATYFSPEQALGEALTPASDIYSLGLVLLEALTGVRAFGGSAVESMTARLARDPDVPAELGDSWAGLLRGMTQRMPESRPTARDVSGALARLAHTTGETDAFSQAGAKADAPTKAYPAADAHRAEPDAEDDRAPRSWRRPVLVAATIALVALLAWPVSQAFSTAFSTVFSGPEPAPAIEYPAVDGTLGTHLEQLQRSVQP